MSDLATIGAATADDPSHRTTINKGHVVEDSGLRRQRDHSRLAVFDPFVYPYQRGFPIEIFREGQGHAVLFPIGDVLGRIELDSHVLL